MPTMKPTRPALPVTRRQAGALLSGAGCALAIRPLLAEDAASAPSGAGLYTVEIVVFRNTGTSAGEDVTAAARNVSADSDSEAPVAGRNARLAAVLPGARYRLNDAASRLNASGHKVIAHVAWAQTASAWNSTGVITAEELGLAAAGISGSVQLERGQYLHLGFNLSYASPGAGRYVLTEMRRVKLAEHNYYDHPALGIIALVTGGG